MWRLRGNLAWRDQESRRALGSSSASLFFVGGEKGSLLRRTLEKAGQFSPVETLGSGNTHQGCQGRSQVYDTDGFSNATPGNTRHEEEQGHVGVVFVG